MTDWERLDKTIILRNMNDSMFLANSSTEGKFVYRDRISSEQLLISYDCVHEVFSVWNASVKRLLKTSNGMITFDRGADAHRAVENGIGEYEIRKEFKAICFQGKKEYVEIVLLIGKKALFEFCQNYTEYLFPKIGDKTDKKIAFATPDSTELTFIDVSKLELDEIVIREKYNSLSSKRDPGFRKRILEKWNYTCAICGCREERILQAAHIKSVKNGGSDKSNNGICLCANHHLLFDSGLLDIDLLGKKFACYSDTELKAPWYIEAEKRNLSLT